LSAKQDTSETTSLPMAIKIALALGGGAARGLAHIGVLKVLEEEKVKVDLIVGTSIGAIIGGLYALDPRAERLEKRVLEYLESEPFRKLRIDSFHQDKAKENSNRSRRWLLPLIPTGFLEKGIFLSRSLTRLSFISPDIVRENSRYLFGDSKFHESRIPLYLIATDIGSGTEAILSRGLIREAVAASCAIPSVMPPVCIDGKLLVDGGCVSLVPIQAARRLGADLVIACNVGKSRLAPLKPLKSGLEVIIRSYDITLFYLRNHQLKEADVLICPKVGEVNWADFSRAKECIREGEGAAREAIGEIRRKKLWKQIRRFFLFKA